MNLLIEVRNYCFFKLKKNQGEDYANDAIFRVLLVILIPHYMACALVIAFVQFHFNIPLPFDKNNLLHLMLFGVVLFSPHYFLLKFLLKKMEDLDPEKSPFSEKKVVIFLLMGMISMFLVPYLLDKIF